MQICTSPQTDNHASIPLLSFYRPDALPAAKPTASKHWRLNSYCVPYKTEQNSSRISDSGQICKTSPFCTAIKSVSKHFVRCLHDGVLFTANHTHDENLSMPVNSWFSKYITYSMAPSTNNLTFVGTRTMVFKKKIIGESNIFWLLLCTFEIYFMSDILFWPDLCLQIEPVGSSGI